MSFAGTPPPGYVLDALFASLTPLFSRWSSIAVATQTAWLDAGVKASMMGQLNLANQRLQDASIEGQLGQRLAMGDVSVAQWAPTVESVADMMEYVAREVGVASWSIPRLWREVVVPTVQEAGGRLPALVPTTFAWAPWVLGGLVVFYALNAAGAVRRVFSPFSKYTRRRRRRT